jgi:hypothetical protein
MDLNNELQVTLGITGGPILETTTTTKKLVEVVNTSY